MSESAEVSHGTEMEIMASFVAWKIQTTMQKWLGDCKKKKSKPWEWWLWGSYRGTYVNQRWTSICCSTGWAAGHIVSPPSPSPQNRPQCRCRPGRTALSGAPCAHNFPAGRVQFRQMCKKYQSERFLQLDHEYNPHHPEALFLGILGRIFRETRHYSTPFCLWKENTLSLCYFTVELLDWFQCSANKERVLIGGDLGAISTQQVERLHWLNTSGCNNRTGAMWSDLN